MKKNYPLRIGIYETNSSSSHSFSMGMLGRLANKLPMDSSKIIHVSTDDWEDGGEKFNDPLYKLSYLLCYAYSISDEGVDNSGVWVRVGYEEMFKAITDVVMKFTGARGVDVDASSGTEIDHQSLDIIDPRDMRDPEFIKEFVFNPGTWVYAVWDSYVPTADFYEKPEMPVLYTIVFDEFPGKPTVPVRYGETTLVSLMVSDVLRNYVWSGENFYPRSDCMAGCIGWSGEGLKFGDKETKISILL